LGTDSPFLTNVFAEIPATVVMIGNDLYHFVPCWWCFLFYLVHSKFVHFSINSVYAHHYLLDNAWKLMLFLVYEAFFGSLASMIILRVSLRPQGCLFNHTTNTAGRGDCPWCACVLESGAIAGDCCHL